MYTSDIKARASKTAAVYLCAALLCTVFGAVYETFSFGVYSFFMTFCFIPPLLLGSVPFFLIFLTGKGMPGRLSFNLYNSGVAALTVGFMFKGVIDIYGTTNNSFSTVYFLVALVFITASAVVWLINFLRHKKSIENNNDM